MTNANGSHERPVPAPAGRTRIALTLAAGRLARGAGRFRREARRLAAEVCGQTPAEDAYGQRLRMLTVAGAELTILASGRKLTGMDGVASLLALWGVGRVELDAGLDAGQVFDALWALWALKKAPGLAGRAVGAGGLAEALAGEGGVCVSCALCRVDARSGVFAVSGAYCPLVFGPGGRTLKRAAVRWRNPRSLFRAAPLLAAAAGALAMAAFACGALAPRGWPWWTVSLVSALAAGAAVFALVEALGSLEQDNENQRREMSWSNRLLGDAYERIQRDVNRARRIQQALLPPEHYQPFNRHSRMAFCYHPESSVGGDHFDYRPLDDRRLAVLLADVSGHGMSAAFITGLVKTTFEMCGQDALAPAKFMARLNDVLCRFTPADSFATAVYVVYDVVDRRMRYANAGHSPRPLIVRAGGGAEVLDEPAGLPAGIEEGLAYEEGECALGPGDCLALASDGVSEAMDAQERALGAEAYYAVAGRAAGQGARALCDAVCAAVQTHEDGAAPHDDQTVLVMEALP